jgi:hypothetical protein
VVTDHYRAERVLFGDPSARKSMPVMSDHLFVMRTAEALKRSMASLSAGDRCTRKTYNERYDTLRTHTLHHKTLKNRLSSSSRKDILKKAADILGISTKPVVTRRININKKTRSPHQCRVDQVFYPEECR